VYTNTFDAEHGMKLYEERLVRENSVAPKRSGRSSALRAYMIDHNYLKTVALKMTTVIRAPINDKPRLNKIIQFNAGGPPIGIGAMNGNSSDER
jgi:hypothetical protein